MQLKLHRDGISCKYLNDQFSPARENDESSAEQHLHHIHTVYIPAELLCLLQFPDPVIKIAIEPKSKADLEKMSTGLIKLAQEDPSFHFSRDEETNQTVIEGMGRTPSGALSLAFLL